MNRFFDRLARDSIATADQPISWYVIWQLIGAGAGLLLAFLLVLGSGLSPTVIAAMAVLCAGAYALPLGLHRLLRRRESLVVMEHLWVGLILNGSFLMLLDIEPWAYLDILVVSVALGLACGRVGCGMGGCCHGLPAGWGIAYPPGSWGPPESRWKNGLRLFPVQLLDATALLFISLSGIALLVFASAGTAFTWFLLAYALMRFASEFLRADRRPEWLGISQAQWMSLLQFGAALWLDSARADAPVSMLASATVALAVAAGLAGIIHRRQQGRFDWPQATALRGAVNEAGQALMAPAEAASRGPVRVEAGENLTLIAQWTAPQSALRLSISDYRFRSLRARCHCLAAALPELEPTTCLLGKDRVLHLVLDWPIADELPRRHRNSRRDAETRGDWIYGWALRNKALRDTPGAQAAADPTGMDA